jgi:uncharacterized repeat protein (TIGR04076 family)
MHLYPVPGKSKKVITLAKMEKVRVTVLRRFEPSEVFKKSPATPVNPLGACDRFKDDQEFVIENLEKPEGFCNTAWISIQNDVRLLAFGGNLPYYKEKGLAINACVDGLRPVIFKLERI